MLNNFLNLNSENNFDQEKSMIPISIVANILNVHQRTLRIYDEENILRPNRSGKNRRLYSLNDIEKGKFIQYLSRDLGINIAGIKVILHFVEQKNLPINKYYEYVEEIAQSLNITVEMQEQNREKLSKRGRKPNKISVG